MKVRLPRKLTDSEIQEKYIQAGTEFGHVASLLPIAGECINFRKYLDEWVKWEREYTKRGFRTIEFYNFVKAGGYGQPIDPNLVKQKRDKGEKPVLQAKIYKENLEPIKFILQKQYEAARVIPAENI